MIFKQKKLLFQKTPNFRAFFSSPKFSVLKPNMASQLLNDKVDKLANILTVLTNGLEKECASETPIEVRTENEVSEPPPPSDAIHMLKLEEEVVSHTVPSNIPIMSSPADTNDTKTCKEDCGSACSDIGGVVASTPDVSDRDIEGEHEYTIIQEL